MHYFLSEEKQVAQNDVKLDNVRLVKHLGHIITSDLTDDKDIMYQTSMYKLCNPTAAVFMDHSYGTYPIRVLTDLKAYH